MTVLPYRAKRFVRHNLTWHNIRFQWAVVGLLVSTAGLSLAYALEDMIPVLTVIISLLAGYVAFSFFLAAWKFPMPLDEPYFVKKYDLLKRWWATVASPGYYGVPQSMSERRIVRNICCDFSEIYDLNGNLIGHEQDVWSNGKWTFTPVATNNNEAMPTIAFWRTKRMKAADIC